MWVRLAMFMTGQGKAVMVVVMKLRCMFQFQDAAANQPTDIGLVSPSGVRANSRGPSEAL